MNKYRKATEILLKPSLIQHTKDPLGLQISNIPQKLPLKGYKEAEIARKLNAHKIKETIVLERASYNSRPGTGSIIPPPRERYSVVNRENRMSAVERGERYSVEVPPARTSFIETQRAQLAEPARVSYTEKEPMKLNPTIEPVAREDKHEEEIVPEKISSFVVNELKKPIPETVNFREQCNKIVEEYAPEIMESLKMKDKECSPSYFLRNHKIPANLRAKMIDWMIEVLGSYKCSEQTFFIAIGLMDLFLERTNVTHEVSDLHLVGVTCMFMASKYEEIYPLRLKVVYDKIAHKKLHPEQIKQKEMEIFSTLNYKMTNVTPYEFIMNALFQLKLKETMTPKLYEYLQKVCIYLVKASLHDYELISQQNYSELAAATLFVAFKIIEQLDKSFPLSQMLNKIIEILQVEDDIVYDCATRILAIAKTFEKLYPNLENLKKFHSFNFDDIAAFKSNDTKGRIHTSHQ